MSGYRFKRAPLGILVPPKDVEAWINAIENILIVEKPRQRSVIVNDFTEENFSDGLIEFLDKIIRSDLNEFLSVELDHYLLVG